MKTVLIAGAVSALALTLGFAGTAVAQDAYPSKPVTLIVPYPAGGANDMLGCLISQKLADRLKQPFVMGAARATGRRLSLYEEIDDVAAAGDPKGAVAPKTDARKAFWGAPRALMIIALSRDGGVAWPHQRNLEVGDGFCMTNNSEGKLNRELSYPSVTQDDAGIIHLAYICFRQRIKYVGLDEDWIAG